MVAPLGTEGAFEGHFGGNEIWLKKRFGSTLEHFGRLWKTLDHQGGGSLITKRKRIQKPRSRVQVQVEDPRSRVQDETWSRPALKRGGGAGPCPLDIYNETCAWTPNKEIPEFLGNWARAMPHYAIGSWPRQV